MTEPHTTIFFGGPRDGELVPPELDDGRGTIDVPVYSRPHVDIGESPPMSLDDSFRIVTYRRHSVLVTGNLRVDWFRADLWCPDEDDPGQYLDALKQHIATIDDRLETQRNGTFRQPAGQALNSE